MKISYNWLNELVPLTLGPRELAERLTMVGLTVESVERLGDDHLLDIDLTSNRPDALSHRGVAREAALICNSAVRPRDISFPESDEAVEEATSVELLAADLCPRFTARVVRGVKVGPSPKWLVARLEAIGQRSVNNIADITNYVMFEMGQPTHAFDLNLLRGRRIVVRRAAPGEQITTLDGTARELASDMLVIADAERAVAVAGVMGGQETEINERTTDVLIESAYFNPVSIRSTARRLGLDTEASYRFARGADPEAQPLASAMVARLIAELAGGAVCKGLIDIYPAPAAREAVALRARRVKRITGLDATLRQAADILRGLEFQVEEKAEEDYLLAVPPSFRVDISREEDLVEEVARHIGYDLLETTLPAWSGEGSHLPHEEQRRRVRQTLAALGYNEAINFSFVNGERDRLFRRPGKQTVTLANPIDVNEDEMRTSLVTGLLDSLQRNANHGNRDVKLFEMGRVFEAAGEGGRPLERETLAVAMTGALVEDDWRNKRQVDFYDLKGAVEAVLASLHLSGFTIERASVEYLHPGQSATFTRNGIEVARLGRLHPRAAAAYKFRQPVYVAEIEFETLLGMPADPVVYRPLPRFPSVSRDVSALVPETVSWDEINRRIGGLGIGDIVSVTLFDMYKGKEVPEGLRSLAFRVVYRNDERTLTDEEVTAMHDRVRALLGEMGAQLR